MLIFLRSLRLLDRSSDRSAEVVLESLLWAWTVSESVVRSFLFSSAELESLSGRRVVSKPLSLLPLLALLTVKLYQRYFEIIIVLRSSYHRYFQEYLIR